tara:strand:+ start:97925 stop:99034 length:1110 start_codon:yes stop_codon:yes gene_type:complete
MNQTLVFLGPSLNVDVAKSIYPDAAYAPPVECGDVLRTVKQGVKRIAIIDGYFAHRAAVWHKEILFALEQGVEVYGSSSMGALRAAELADYGMRGVGEIFELFYTQALEDDDEVAVLHRDAEVGYQTLSDAMVSIRKSLQMAVANNIIDSNTEKKLSQQAKQTFYPERSWQSIVAEYPQLTHHYVDLKANDAKLLLQTLATNQPIASLDSVAPKTFVLQRLYDQVACEHETEKLPRLLQHCWHMHQCVNHLPTQDALDINAYLEQHGQTEYAVTASDIGAMLKHDFNVNLSTNDDKMIAVCAIIIEQFRKTLNDLTISMNPNLTDSIWAQIQQRLANPDVAPDSHLIETYFLIQEFVNQGSAHFITANI